VFTLSAEPQTSEAIQADEVNDGKL
jgi:hypothetical protein